MAARIRTLLALLLLTLITGQAATAVAATAPAPDYQHEIRPLLEHRCLVCHGCYDAPCQLKLDSYQGLARGATKAQIYSTARLSPAAPSRLFEDAQTTSGWRVLGFSPVVPDQPDASEGDRRAGVLARILELKKQHPLPAGKVLPETFDFSLGRAQQCPRVEEFDSFANRFPQWGMPFGLPPLSESEQICEGRDRFPRKHRFQCSAKTKSFGF